MGIIHSSLSADNLRRLEELAREKLNDPDKIGCQNKLAGQMQNEFLIPEANPIIKQQILSMAYEYCNTAPGSKFFNIDFDNECLELTGGTAWINYQYKHEFNPLHDHGGLLSFVMWVDIPFTRESENIASPGRDSVGNCSGAFTFVYSDVFGKLSSCTPEIDFGMDLTGQIFMFPAKLYHMVSPFYSSDQPRISIAGNVDRFLKSQE